MLAAAAVPGLAPSALHCIEHGKSLVEHALLLPGAAAGAGICGIGNCVVSDVPDGSYLQSLEDILTEAKDDIGRPEGCQLSGPSTLLVATQRIWSTDSD